MYVHCVFLYNLCKSRINIFRTDIPREEMHVREVSRDLVSGIEREPAGEKNER